MNALQACARERLKKVEAYGQEYVTASILPGEKFTGALSDDALISEIVKTVKKLLVELRKTHPFAHITILAPENAFNQAVADYEHLKKRLKSKLTQYPEFTLILPVTVAQKQKVTPAMRASLLAHYEDPELIAWNKKSNEASFAFYHQQAQSMLRKVDEVDVVSRRVRIMTKRAGVLATANLSKKIPFSTDPESTEKPYQEFEHLGAAYKDKRLVFDPLPEGVKKSPFVKLRGKRLCVETYLEHRCALGEHSVPEGMTDDQLAQTHYYVVSDGVNPNEVKAPRRYLECTSVDRSRGPKVHMGEGWRAHATAAYVYDFKRAEVSNLLVDPMPKKGRRAPDFDALDSVEWLSLFKALGLPKKPKPKPTVEPDGDSDSDVEMVEEGAEKLYTAPQVAMPFATGLAKSASQGTCPGTVLAC